ncbi:hypothetical protein K2173_004393 [Erythroxylum novogranatense]|uniref:Protein kinase domain-containing protein n=1 Tax=Erythroxylum novogranatense TaxID=1862640 RepID=A0AAV8T4D5_9ROSI|nr:hypothetical protein K2173_004393 [Erythroxylum novogranatense]
MKCVRLVAVVVAFTASFSLAFTDPSDVEALNSLWYYLNLPILTGWMPVGGDPCGDNWQGVGCVLSNITNLNLNGLNLGGTVAESLPLFNSILQIDLSNNHISGSIPVNLPPTLQNLSLGSNELNGRIPDSLSSLSQLSYLSVSNNLLSGLIPDAFQQLTTLTTLDLSGNSLNGGLPLSMGNLSSLNSLQLQNNQLTGTLHVLQDLPLQDLNVQNNLFSGPIPAKLLTIPNFRKDGNPFNTTIIYSPPPLASPPIASASIASPPMPDQSPASIPPILHRTNSERSNIRLMWSILAGGVTIIALGICVLSMIFFKKKKAIEYAKRHDSAVYKGQANSFNDNSSLQCYNQSKKALPTPSNGALEKGGQGINPVECEIDVKGIGAYSRDNTDHKIDTTGVDLHHTQVQQPHAHIPRLPIDKVTINSSMPKQLHMNTTGLKSFTVATLQQCTHSFSEENFIGEGNFGSVYEAVIPGGKLLAVKKLRSTAWELTDGKFLELVSNISKIQHANIVDLVGYCNEHGQHLLVSEYYKNGTLYDALHVDDEVHKNLSWHTRIQLALGAARALQHLHEVCKPPIVHQNFKATNILLDEELIAHVSDCCFPPRACSSASELTGDRLSSYGYSAPECESGSCTCKSDVYSFGVVMLELLTGRKTYDRSRPRGEQHLVRWVIPQLHDIDALCGMVDPSLGGRFPVKSLSRLADTIARCLQWDPEFRPAMSEIVQDLLQM